MNDALISIGSWFSVHLDAVAMTLATALMIFSASFVTKKIRERVRRYPWVVRISVFILMCAVGYGLLTLFVGKAIAWFLGGLSQEALALMVIMAFIGVGVVAENKREI